MLVDLLRWDGWRPLTIAGCVVLAVACLVFVVAYQWKVGWSWWRQPDGSVNLFGRYLMTRKLLELALVAVVLSNRVWPGWLGREMAVAALMWAFALQTFIPYGLLLKAQAETRAHPNQEAVLSTTGDPATAGPNGDGSQSLARESKYGNFVNGLAVTGMGYLALALGDIDFTPLPDAVEPIIVAVVGVAIGLITSWVTKNRKTTAARRY